MSMVITSKTNSYMSIESGVCMEQIQESSKVKSDAEYFDEVAGLSSSSVKTKMIKEGDKNPQPSTRDIEKVGKYIAVNYDGDMVESEDTKKAIHDTMIADASDNEGIPILYTICKVGELAYYYDEDWGWVIDQKKTKGMHYIATARSFRRVEML